MWQALKEKYGGLLATKLRDLVMKFVNYKILLNHTNETTSQGDEKE